MTDERFVFQQDVKERRQMKNGALHKKNGSKSKRCTLPSDHLTSAQKKKMSGSVETISLNAPITSIKELRTYIATLQTEYLQNCIDTYGARRIDIIHMLNTNSTNFRKYLDRNNINLIFPQHPPRGRRSKMDDRWLDFITKPEDKVVKKTDEQIIEEHFGIKLAPVVEKAEPVVEVIMPEEPKSVKKVSGYSSVLKMQLNLKGSKAEIMHMMDAILGDECTYAVDLKIVNTNREENA